VLAMPFDEEMKLMIKVSQQVLAHLTKKENSSIFLIKKFSKKFLIKNLKKIIKKK